MRAIGAHFGVHRTTVAKAVRALESLQADVRGDAFYLEKKRPIST
jgi:DNA-binding transcriptional regulator YhcF (GntR family)